MADKRTEDPERSRINQLEPCSSISADLINLEDFTSIIFTVPLQQPATLYHHSATVSLGVHELSLPTSFLKEFGFDIPQGSGKFRSQKFMGNTAYGFFALPTIHLVGARIPILDFAFHVANHDRFVKQIEKLGIVTNELACRLGLDLQSCCSDLCPCRP